MCFFSISDRPNPNILDFLINLFFLLLGMQIKQLECICKTNKHCMILVLLVTFCFQFYNLNLDLKLHFINFYCKLCILQIDEISNIGHITCSQRKKAQERCTGTLRDVFSKQNVMQSALGQAVHRHDGC